MKLKIAIAIFIVLLVLGGLAGVKALQIQKLIAAGKSFAQPPETVSSVEAREEKWQGIITSIGTIAAVQGVTVTPDIPGVVKQIAFESGTLVAKGDLLVKLDTSSEDAQYRAIMAQVELDKINLDRARTLRKENTLAQSDLDTAEATLKQNLANADVIHATIEKKTIRAPFAGQAGIRMVNLGQYLDTGKPIVSLQALAPVYAGFSVPQQELSRLKQGMRVRVSSDAYPSNSFAGILTAINPDLDSSTRSVSLQATFDNKEQLLRPGMFVRVEVLLPEEQTVLVIPETSVLSAPYGSSVYLIETSTNQPASTSTSASSSGTNAVAAAQPGLVVRQIFIRPGRARGDMLSVESGLKPGARIVSAGLFKLRNGMAVKVNNTLSPKSELAPQPQDN